MSDERGSIDKFIPFVREQITKAGYIPTDEKVMQYTVMLIKHAEDRGTDPNYSSLQFTEDIKGDVRWASKEHKNRRIQVRVIKKFSDSRIQVAEVLRAERPKEWGTLAQVGLLIQDSSLMKNNLDPSQKNFQN